jgi:hypothetical protein
MRLRARGPRRMLGSKNREEQKHEDDYIMLIFIVFTFYMFMVIKSRETNMVEIKNVCTTSSDKIIKE